MRTAYTEVGFITENEQLLGFSMGFDFCAQHERGQPWLKSQLGLPEVQYQDGLKTRTATKVPTHLRLVTYEHRPQDKRFKKSMPAAILSVARYLDDDLPVEELISRLSLDFPFEFTDKRWYKPDTHDVVSSWSENDGFAIHVRGQKNVERLQELKAAFDRCDITFGQGGGMSFIRTAPALVIASRMPAEKVESIQQADTAYRNLQEAARATGIYERLAAAGIKYFALSPSWYAGEGSDLLFFLNPYNQKDFDGGWFTVDELDAWIEGKGPVVDGKTATEALREIETDFEYHLLVGLKPTGIGLRVGTQAVWLDKDKRQVGLRILPAKGSEDKLPRGVYSLEQLMPYVQAGKEECARQKSEKKSETVA